MYDYVTEEDNLTQKELRQREAESRGTPKTNGAKMLLAWAIEKKRAGRPFANPGKQRQALAKISRMKLTVKQVQNRWNDLENDEFYQKAGIDFMTIANSFDRKAN